MKPSIIEFVKDAQLLGLPISDAQECLLKAAYGLPLSDDDLELCRQCTGREKAPHGPYGEITVIAGARSGKDSRIAAPIAIYEALFGSHEKQLAKGERAIIPLVAQDHRATKIAFSYIRDYLTGSPLLASMIEEVFSSEIRLTNRVDISCFPSTLRSLRGWSIPAAVMDELAFYRLEGSADSDAEIQASIRRGMVSFPSPRLVKVSTPYFRSGILYEDFKAAYGQDDPDRLVWKAPTLLMNPSIKSERLERERRLDPSRFSREYEAEFSDDLEAFCPSNWIDEAVVNDRHELPRLDGVHYVAAVDPSGGGADAFTVSIVHVQGTGADRHVIQDVMKGWRRTRGKKVDLEAAVKEIAEILRRYRLSSAFGDPYAAGWVREAFQREGIQYQEAQLTKAQAYLEVEPLLAQNRIELLDHPQLVRELGLLEKRPRSGGRTIVDHPRGGHDDHANALALAAAKAMKTSTVDPCAFPLGVGHIERREDYRWGYFD